LLAVVVVLAGAWVVDRGSVREMLGRPHAAPVAAVATEGE
jgi:hypothetical protein